MDFRDPKGVWFPQKYYHNRLQGKPYEKKIELFSNTKINATKVETEKKDEKMESGFHTSLDLFWTFFDKCFG